MQLLNIDMENIQIIKGTETSINSKLIAELIYTSFKQKANAFNVNKNIAVNIINESFNLNNCFLALISNNLAGIIGYTIKNFGFMEFKYKYICKHFSIFKSIFYYFILNWYNINLSNEELMFESLAVDKTFRRKGIGQNLIRFVENYALSNNYKKVSLEVVNTNHSAIALYKKLGYTIVKEKHFGKITKKAGFSSNFLMTKYI